MILLIWSRSLPLQLRTRTCCRSCPYMTGADLKLAPNASIQTEMHYFSRKNVKVLAVFLEA